MQLFKDDVLKFIESHAVGVIATANENGQPSTAAVYYIVSSKKTIRFITKSGTVKHQNLSRNPKIAMTVIDPDKPITVSIEGVARPIEDPAEHHEVLQAITQLGNKELGDFAPIIKLHKGSFVSYEFTPERAKLTDFTAPLHKTQEQLHSY